MRLISIKIFVLVNFILVTACGGGGSSEPIVDPNSGDPNPVDSQGGAASNTLVNGVQFSWPGDFNVIAGEAVFNFDLDTYDYQSGRVIANASDSIRCSDGIEIGGSFDVDTVNAQVVSSYEGQIISVNAISTDLYSGQEVILSYVSDADVDLNSIARHYYIGSDRFDGRPGDSAVFYFRCNTLTSEYAQNEVVIRSILDSVEFTYSP